MLRRADGPALETTHPDLLANALKTSIDNCRAIPRGSYSIERIIVSRNMFVVRTFVLTENESEVQLYSCFAFRRGGLYLATGFGKQMERYSREKNRRLQSHLAREVLPRFAESSRNDDGDHEAKRGDSDDGRPRRALQSDGRIRRLSTDFVSGRATSRGIRWSRGGTGTVENRERRNGGSMHEISQPLSRFYRLDRHDRRRMCRRRSTTRGRRSRCLWNSNLYERERQATRCPGVWTHIQGA